MSDNTLTKINQFIEKYYDSERINFRVQYEIMDDIILIEIKYNETILLWYIDYDFKELETSFTIRNKSHGQTLHSHDGEHQQHFHWNMKTLY